jgi:hypothetical protein
MMIPGHHDPKLEALSTQIRPPQRRCSALEDSGIGRGIGAAVDGECAEGGWAMVELHTTLRREQASTGFLLPSMIRTAHQWASFHMPEAAGQSLLAQLPEFLGGIEAEHREVLSRRLQILANGQEIAVHRTEVLHHVT